jgi:hypothetical protein
LDLLKIKMESSTIVIFYSKYSTKCTEFFELVRDIIDFRKICVDHPEIRTTLLNEADKYFIRKVPSVIVFFSNGVMNKYEDEKAFEWALTVRKNMIKVTVDEIGPHPPVNQKQVTVLDSIEPLLPKQLVVLPPQVAQTQEEDLVGMKRRIETTPLIQRPSGGTLPDDQRMDGNRNERKVHDKKADSIKNLAQQLQAEREKEDEQIAPNAISKINT